MREVAVSVGVRSAATVAVVCDVEVCATRRAGTRLFRDPPVVSLH